MPVSHYLPDGFNPDYVNRAVARAVKQLRKHAFDAIAVRGVSGLIIAPIVCYILKKQLIVVRKDEDKHHDGIKVEVAITDGTYVVFDDFVSSGATVRAIVAGVTKAAPRLKPLGIYQWRAERGAKVVDGLSTL